MSFIQLRMKCFAEVSKIPICNRNNYFTGNPNTNEENLKNSQGQKLKWQFNKYIEGKRKGWIYTF